MNLLQHAYPKTYVSTLEPDFKDRFPATFLGSLEEKDRILRQGFPGLGRDWQREGLIYRTKYSPRGKDTSLYGTPERPCIP